MKQSILLLVVVFATHASADVCRMSAPDRTFIEAATKTWEVVRADALELPQAPLPLLVLFDEKCVWRGGAGAKHDGTIALPGGGDVPARVVSFAGSDDRGHPFLVMALPSVWRTEERHAKNAQLDRLLRSVFVHEMTHTRQTGALGKRLDEIEARHGIELDDDIVQTRFAAREGFRAAYEQERDRLFAIAAEPDARKRRTLVQQAVRLAHDRRVRFFTNEEAIYAELEEIFLGMEGVANWAAYRAAMADGMSRADAIAFIRRDGKRWSQDEGLALFLAIDALMPRWQRRVFGETPTPVWQLLGESAGIR